MPRKRQLPDQLELQSTSSKMKLESPIDSDVKDEEDVPASSSGVLWLSEVLDFVISSFMFLSMEMATRVHQELGNACIVSRAVAAQVLVRKENTEMSVDSIENAEDEGTAKRTSIDSIEKIEDEGGAMGTSKVPQAEEAVEMGPKRISIDSIEKIGEDGGAMDTSNGLQAEEAVEMGPKHTSIDSIEKIEEEGGAMDKGPQAKEAVEMGTSTESEVKALKAQVASLQAQLEVALKNQGAASSSAAPSVQPVAAPPVEPDAPEEIQSANFKALANEIFDEYEIPNATRELFQKLNRLRQVKILCLGCTMNEDNQSL